MKKIQGVSQDSFVTFTTMGEMNSGRTRKIVASHASKVRRSQAKKKYNTQTNDIVQSFLRWRVGPAPAKAPDQPAGQSQNNTEHTQAISEIGNVLASIPAYLCPSLSLQQLFKSSPALFLPAQIMLDAGNPYAGAFFPTIDLKVIYHAVMGVFLSWLSTQYPSKYPISAALYHQGKAIPILRRLLSEGVYNDETYVSILCAMQTEALMGNEKALAAHQSGLETLSRAMTSGLNEYCRSMKTRHEYLVTKPGQSPMAMRGHIQSRRSLQYLSFPYSRDVIDMISVLPPVLQDLAYQEHGLSLDMITYFASFAGWANQALSNLSPISTALDLDSASPIYAMLSELWSILCSLSSQTAQLERLLCITHYLLLTSSYYRRIVQRTIVFRMLRTEATEIAMKYEPNNQAERDNLIVHSMLVVQAWKTSDVLEAEGRLLLRNLKDRFLEARQWETLEITLMKFPSIAPAMAEKKDCWLQSCSLTND